MMTLTAPMDIMSLMGDAIASEGGSLAGMQCRMIGWLYFATVAASPGDAAHVETQVRHLLIDHESWYIYALGALH